MTVNAARSGSLLFPMSCKRFGDAASIEFAGRIEPFRISGFTGINITACLSGARATNLIYIASVDPSAGRPDIFVGTFANVHPYRRAPAIAAEHAGFCRLYICKPGSPDRCGDQGWNDEVSENMHRTAPLIVCGQPLLCKTGLLFT